MEKRGSDAAIADIVRMSRGITVSEMGKISSLAAKAGGVLASVDGDDDDTCGNGRIKFKWPPKREEFGHLLDMLVASRINFQTLINGIPVPDEVMINISKRMNF